MTDANDEALLRRLVVALSAVPGIAAIALGGSRARGTATAASDYDIGLYYHADRPIDVAALGKVAALLDDRGAEASVTPIGGWGPWIDGGGWLVVAGVHVDLLYRDLDRVLAAIDDAHAGKVERFYQPGHPHAFLPRSTWARWPVPAFCTIQPARSPPCSGARRPIRRRSPRRCASASNGRQASRSPMRARASSAATSPTWRAAPSAPIACLCQTLFALNGVYLLNEKGAVAAVDGFALSPPGFAKRVAHLFADLGSGKHAAGLDCLQALITETCELSAR